MRQTVLRRGAGAVLVALVFCVGCGPSLAEIKDQERVQAEWDAERAKKAREKAERVYWIKISKGYCGALQDLFVQSAKTHPKLRQVDPERIVEMSKSAFDKPVILSLLWHAAEEEDRRLLTKLDEMCEKARRMNSYMNTTQYGATKCGRRLDPKGVGEVIGASAPAGFEKRCDDVKRYLKKYPNGRFVAKAQELLKDHKRRLDGYMNPPATDASFTVNGGANLEAIKARRRTFKVKILAARGKEVKDGRAEETEFRKCLSWDRCKLDCPDGGIMKTIKISTRRRRFCEKKGKQHGPEVRWHMSGQMMAKVTYKDGEPHGVATWWYDNGEVHSEEAWKDGKRHGPSTTWHDNGQLSQKGNYKNGKPHGLETSWRKDGELFMTITYKDGEVVNMQ